MKKISLLVFFAILFLVLLSHGNTFLPDVWAVRLHTDHHVSGEGTFDFRIYPPPGPGHWPTIANMGWNGPGGPDPGAYDNIFIENLPQGDYRIQTLAKYGGQADEHLIIESSSGSIELIQDLNGPDCPEESQCWGEVEVDVCPGEVFPAEGTITIRAWSQMYPAVLSLSLYEVDVERVGNGASCPNSAPEAENLEVTELDYCFAAAPPVVLGWEYDDPDDDPPGTDPQSAYQVQADDDSDFSSVEIDSGKVSSNSQEYAPQGAQAMDYGVSYYWRVKVWDSEDNESSWAVAGSPVATAAHAWPDPRNLSWTPENPVAGQPVQFYDDDEGEEGDSFDGDPFDPAVNPLDASWDWDFGDGDSSTLEDPEHIFDSPQNYNIELTACDELNGTNRCCTADAETELTSFPFPRWREISPF